MNDHISNVTPNLLVDQLQNEIRRVSANRSRCTGDAERCVACRDTRPYVHGLEYAIQRIRESE